jgi:uncharacterized membrane protein YphA (DoxX/SURF4 family)
MISSPRQSPCLISTLNQGCGHVCLSRDIVRWHCLDAADAARPKLIGSDSAVQEFGLIGAGQWLRYLIGTAELAGAIGLLTPWLAGLAAAGLAADMAGATNISATVLHNTIYGVNVWMTALLCAVFVLVAYGRRQQIKRHGTALLWSTHGILDQQHAQPRAILPGHPGGARGAALAGDGRLLASGSTD